jgi:DNA uptake protein ComE-like DNA-binding protein
LSLDQLLTVPDLDEAEARRILQQRQNGPYRNLIDLQQRLQVPGDRLTDWMHYLRFQPQQVQEVLPDAGPKI